MSDIKVDLDNLTKVERETLLSLVKKANKSEPPIWVPDVGEEFFSVVSRGGIFTHKRLQGTDTEKFLKDGNIFKTRELAERMAERRKRTGIFENKMMEFADGYEFSENSINRYVFFDTHERKWRIGLSKYLLSPLNVYMPTGSAEKAVRWANKHFPDGL